MSKGELVRTIRYGDTKIYWADEQPEPVIRSHPLSDQIEMLVRDIRGIESNWETRSGADLAGAVRNAIATANLIESNRFWASNEWHVDDVRYAMIGTKYEAYKQPSPEAMTEYLNSQINNDFFVGEINDTIKENLSELWDSDGIPVKATKPFNAQLVQAVERTPSASETLNKIWNLLDGEEWDSGTMSEVAEILTLEHGMPAFADPND